MESNDVKKNQQTLLIYRYLQRSAKIFSKKPPCRRTQEVATAERESMVASPIVIVKDHIDQSQGDSEGQNCSHMRLISPLGQPLAINNPAIAFASPLLATYESQTLLQID